jgi:hypothetical protein
MRARLRYFSTMRVRLVADPNGSSVPKYPLSSPKSMTVPRVRATSRITCWEAFSCSSRLNTWR